MEIIFPNFHFHFQGGRIFYFITSKVFKLYFIICKYFSVFNKEIKVPVTTLDTWAERNNISHADFLWLDLQGSELPVMKKSPKIMKTVKVLLVEVEMVEAYKNQALAGEVKQWLEGEGFALIAKDFDETKDWCGNYLFVRE